MCVQLLCSCLNDDCADCIEYFGLDNSSCIPRLFILTFLDWLHTTGVNITVRNMAVCGTDSAYIQGSVQWYWSVTTVTSHDPHQVVQRDRHVCKSTGVAKRFYSYTIHFWCSRGAILNKIFHMFLLLQVHLFSYSNLIWIIGKTWTY